MTTPNLFNIYEITQLEAAYGILNKTDLFFYRKVCRWYSSTFHTPLHLVQSGTVQWDELLTHYYEYHYDKLKYNEVLNIAKSLLPTIAKEEEEDEDRFIQELMIQDKLKKQSLKKSAQSPDNELFPQTTPKNPSEEEVKFFDVDESEEQ